MISEIDPVQTIWRWAKHNLFRELIPVKSCLLKAILSFQVGFGH